MMGDLQKRMGLSSATLTGLVDGWLKLTWCTAGGTTTTAGWFF
jgi:hypothetical protein